MFCCFTQLPSILNTEEAHSRIRHAVCMQLNAGCLGHKRLLLKNTREREVERPREETAACVPSRHRVSAELGVWNPGHWQWRESKAKRRGNITAVVFLTAARLRSVLLCGRNRQTDTQADRHSGRHIGTDRQMERFSLKMTFPTRDIKGSLHSRLPTESSPWEVKTRGSGFQG